MMVEKDIFSGKDPSNMYEKIYNLPEQILEAWEIGKKADISILNRRWKNIILAGMGGSAIGGDIIKSLGYWELKVPFSTIRDYSLPGFVNEETLLIIVSYSGNTEESIGACKEGLNKGAGVLIITSGGEIENIAKERHIPLISVPQGFPPRAALGYTFMPVLAVLSKMELMNVSDGDIQKAADLMRKMRDEELKDEISEEKNIAKKLANKMYGHLPIIYAPDEYLGVTAYRWKCQLNENSKLFAIWNSFPELNHNEIMGWEGRDEFLKNAFVVFLRDKGEIDRIKQRIQYMKDLIIQISSGIEEVWSEGDTLLERFLSLIYIGDFVSFYLAIKRGVDPTPVNSIEGLKKYLKGEG
ncbi:MAG TPA: bifunctional phosphoglucose/phosphomannose isomerase [bacterium]|nr:bifunctional phosphoglucose/phosphomannose isomerase [Dictyoglomota bacterium]HOK29240.1 bifunctional phosphoglucose/phosphomannose isomerase [bacterium]HON72043.1 bifunctional phosphoglucose/phosphomannose isomerase [bacterium]HPO81608.1 bifunctional phosphoglucose/phosphomannose isomerase [bacterium]HRR91665.1 bifunctional phosphoglucose/phosphomannose isomerase [bacterium]